MKLTWFLIVPACVFLGWYVAATLLIYDSLRRRGERVSLIWLRAAAPWYASRYRQITRKETGKTGPLFYHWIISINAMAVLVLLAVITHYL